MPRRFKGDFMVFFPIGDVPDEVKAEIQRQHDLHEMSHQEWHHSMNRVFDELNREQLEFVGTLIQATHGQCLEGKGSGGYVIGRIAEILRTKFSQCPCGKNHDDVPVPESVSQNENKEPEEPEPLLEKAQPEYTPEELKGMTPKEYIELLAKYEVMQVPLTIEVACMNGCGRRWPSLEDRMLRPPGKDGCDWCQERSAWG